MKVKIISLCTALVFLFSIGAPTVSAYENVTFNPFYVGDSIITNAGKTGENVNLTIPAKSAILIEATTGKVIYELNSDEQLPPASITKIMTLLIVMEEIQSGNIKLEDKVNITPHAMSMGGSQIWLEPGEEMTVDELLKATAIASANDAAVALGEHIEGSEEVFIARMNQRASELGMTNTVFKNATGLDADGHLSTARDISIMSKELLKHEYILKYTTTWMDSLRNGETQLVNTNKLVRFYEGSTGLKTGTTSGAGSCLAASANRNGLKLVAVTMGSATSDERFKSAKTLLDYGYSKFEMATIPTINDEYKEIAVKNGVLEGTQLTYNLQETLLVEKGKKDKLTMDIQLNDSVTAPVEKGQTVGKVSIKVGDNVVLESEIKTIDSVEQMGIKDAFKLLFRDIFKN